MSYEDLEKARAERVTKEAAKEAKKTERGAKKAEKEAKKAAKEAEEATAGKSTRGRKRKSAATEADTPESMAKAARTSGTQVTEDGIAPEPWRAESVPRRVLEKARLVLKYATLQKLTLDEL